MTNTLLPRTNAGIETAYHEVTQATHTRQNTIRTKRAELDLKKTFIQEQNVLMNKARSGELTPDELLNGLSQLNTLETDISTFSSQLINDQPKTKGAKLTSTERKAIYGLYHSGEYKQDELAEIYDVKQPSISSIVRKPPSTYIDIDNET